MANRDNYKYNKADKTSALSGEGGTNVGGEYSYPAEEIINLQLFSQIPGTIYKWLWFSLL